MATGLVPIRTPRGQAELNARARRVGQRHRTVLFLIDGKRNADEVRAMAVQAGVPESAFGELIELGMIMLSEPEFAQSTVRAQLDPAAAQAPVSLHVDVRLPGPDSVFASADSVLPPSRSLFPESGASGDSALGSLSGAQAWLNADAAAAGSQDDPVFVEARLILVRAVRSQAPLVGAITQLKLRRARTRSDLRQLLDEVEDRLSRPHPTLAATHTMQRVRQLLSGRLDALFEPA